jgi:hypothetical protein
VRRVRFILAAILLCPGAVGTGQPVPSAGGNEEHRIVLEIGPAISAGGSEGTRVGGSIAAEKTVVEDWLELELGISAVTGRGETEVGGSLLFKKPWQLTRRIELMIGVGPELVHADAGTRSGAIAVVDVMFWPGSNVGWYVEPGYEMVFQHGSHGSFTATGGLLIGF